MKKERKKKRCVVVFASFLALTKCDEFMHSTILCYRISCKVQGFENNQTHRPFPKDSVLMCVFIGCAMYDHNLAVMAHLNLSCYIESGLCYYN